MNDTSPTKDEKAAASEEPADPLAGLRLAKARQANDISIAEIAKELHLDERKVQALEENQFDVLGPPVFAKGYLRKYAELVAVPVDDVLSDYYRLNRASGAPPVVGPRKPAPPRDIKPGRWIAGALIISIIVAALFWWLNREPSSEPGGTLPEPFATDRLPTDTEDSRSAPVVDSNSDIEPAETLPETPVTVDAGLSEVVQDNTAEVDNEIADGVELVMIFSGDCWTEVTDAHGDRLFFDLGRAGQTISRIGKPPLRALFGDRNNVSVTVDGIEFPIENGRGRRGNTATITITAQ